MCWLDDQVMILIGLELTGTSNVKLVKKSFHTVKGGKWNTKYEEKVNGMPVTGWVWSVECEREEIEEEKKREREREREREKEGE